MQRILAALLVAVLLPAATAQQLPAGAAPPAPTALERELAAIDDVTVLRGRALDYQQAGKHADEAAVWRRIVELRPHVGAAKLELAAANARLGDRAAAYTPLMELQSQGYGFDISGDPRFKVISDTQVWQFILDAFAGHRQPAGQGEVFATLPREDLLIESLAWDGSRKKLLAGSIREGMVYTVEKDGRLKPLAKADEQNGMWAVMDVVADAERGVLWIASTAVPHYKGYKPERDLGRAGVFKFDLKTGKFLKRYLSPAVVGHAFFLSSLALAPDGTLFAADGVNNAIYMVRDDQLKRVFHAPSLTSLRGLAVSDDGRRLYFADHELGVIGYDLAAGKPIDLAIPRTLALGGIDGLLWWNGGLVAIQGGMKPARVMRLVLSPNGDMISRAFPLYAAQPDMPLPTLGTIDGNQLYFIGNGQKHLYDRFGLPRKREAIEATRVLRVAVDQQPLIPGG